MKRSRHSFPVQTFRLARPATHGCPDGLHHRPGGYIGLLQGQPYGLLSSEWAQELVQEAEDVGTQEQHGQASADRPAHATTVPWRPASAGNIMARCSAQHAPLCSSCKAKSVLTTTWWCSRCPRKPVHYCDVWYLSATEAGAACSALAWSS